MYGRKAGGIVHVYQEKHESCEGEACQQDRIRFCWVSVDIPSTLEPVVFVLPTITRLQVLEEVEQ